MLYREVGNTGIRISEIGFGSGGTAGLMVRGEPEAQREAVARAVDDGINYFDTAPDYGSGIAETNLGRVFKELGIRPFITTKVEVRNADLKDIAGHVVDSVDQSLARLGLDWVDFVQIHNGPVAERPKLEGSAYQHLWVKDFLRPGGALEGLERVQRAGKTRFLGFICRGNDAGPARELIDTGSFHLINLSYHLLNPSAGVVPPGGMLVDQDYGQIIDYALARKVGVAVYSPLASGALTDHAVGGGARHPLSGRPGGVSTEEARMIERARALAFLAKPGSPTLGQVAMQFILMHPGVTTVLGGFSELAHLDEAVAVPGSGALPDESLARVEMVWRANFGQPSTPAAAKGDG